MHPPIDEIIEIAVDDGDVTRTIRIGACLTDKAKGRIISFLKDNAAIFAWTVSDMQGIDPTITTHSLNVDPTFKSVR